MMDPSKERSFNEQWKKAFDEASITPPASAWEGIEARLDHDAIKGTFADQWGNAFSDVAITPVPAVWEAIEARLDKEDDVRIIPFWWQSTKVWYAAASIAGLLIVGGLWLKNGANENVKSSEIAVNAKQPVKKESGTSAAVQSETQKIGEIKGSKEISALTNKTIASDKTASKNGTDPGKAKNAGVTNEPYKSFTKVADLNNDGDLSEVKKGGLAATNGIDPGSPENGRIKVFAGDQPVLLSSKSNFDQPVLASKSVEIGALKSAELLTALPYKDLDVYFQKRYVFYEKNESKPEVPIKKHQEYWAGLGVMPGSFNPHINIKTSPASFANQSFASQKSLTGKNDPGFSYAVQTQGGMRISKHWSVESGITYLQGNSQYEGGGYLLNAATSGSSNVLENALADAFYSNKGITSTPSINSIYIDVSKQVRNDYQYLQLPVQVGFTLNPEGKLSYSVLGGMMANFFLNNELQSDNGDVIKTTASDDVYRGTNWAATTGLRFNYRFSSKWRAMLTGSYQKAVTSGFRANQNLESHPSLYGVSWGMRYSF